VTTGGRGVTSTSSFFSAGSGVDILRRLLLKCDHIGFGAEEAGNFAGQFRVEGLIDGGKNPARQQARDEGSLARTSSFSARSLTLMPSVIVMLRVMGIGSFDTTIRGGGT